MPPIGHVFVIVLENSPYTITFGPRSPSPYLAHTLTRQGALLRQYYAIGHDSLPNYVAMISGQAPNPATQHDCHDYSEFVPATPAAGADGQLPGKGCIYPDTVRTVADQLRAAGLKWKGYMEGMGADPAREAATCAHPRIGTRDHTRYSTPKDRYATKHDPFVYFHSIIDDPTHCAQHVVNLDRLTRDLRSSHTTPQLAFIVPDLCHDGHNAPCSNGEAGGLVSADAFLRTWVPRITSSKAFRKDGLLIITVDEGTGTRACCGERGLPDGPPAGKSGPGGGRVGAVLLSPWIRPGSVSDVPYNHYSLLRSIEDIFGLPHLGYAGMPGLKSFGTDVFKLGSRSRIPSPSRRELRTLQR